jgi:hypothetical protein
MDLQLTCSNSNGFSSQYCRSIPLQYVKSYMGAQKWLMVVQTSFTSSDLLFFDLLYLFYLGVCSGSFRYSSDLRHPTATYLSCASLFPAGHCMAAWQHVGNQMQLKPRAGCSLQCHFEQVFDSCCHLVAAPQKAIFWSVELQQVGPFAKG